MTDADLAAIRARLAAATPGPWRLQTCACGAGCADAAAVKAGGALVVECAPDADADLIAHAPTDIAALLAEVERLRGRHAGVIESLRDSAADVRSRDYSAARILSRIADEQEAP